LEEKAATTTMTEETIASEVLAASLGGAISATILYPLEVLKTKMQCVSDDDEDDDDENGDNGGGGEEGKATTKKTMIPFALQLYNDHGWSVFFRGVETSAFQSALEKALYFFAYTGLKRMHAAVLVKQGGDSSSSKSAPPMGGFTNLLLGCAAEWAHLPITLPVDAWTTKIQTSTDAPMNILLTMLGDKKHHRDLYKGISAYSLLCFKPALQYTVYEQAKSMVLQRRRQRQQHYRNSSNSTSSTINTSLSAAEAFALGMVARTIATVLVFPFLRAKVLMQTSSSTTASGSGSNKKGIPNAVQRSSEDDEMTKTTMSVVLYRQYQRAGLAGLYQGIGPELTRGIFSAALMLMIKERIAEMVRTFFAPGRKQL
jgi:solute carrier family 25 (peroxisomal adenine nucleotide transporter), member 17